MDDIVQQLEIRIRALINHCKQLERANQYITQTHTAKNRLAISQIRHMISHLESVRSIDHE